MKKFLLLVSGLICLNSVNAQWIPQTPPNPTNNLYSVFALDPNSVAATGFTGPIRSLNAGALWTQNVSLGGVNTYEIHSKNPFRWYVLTQNSSWFMKISNPGGVTLQSSKPDSILSLHFRDLACAVAVGTGGKIETTCDTGATWQMKSSGTANNLNAIWFSDADSACAVGTSGVIKRTKDGGNTWTTIVSGTSNSLNGIHFPTPTVGYIVGIGGKVLKTTDAGLNWTNMPTGVLNALNGVFFVDQDTGYVCGSGGIILKTLNGGSTWNPMASGTTQILNSIHFATFVDGWCVGNGGTILKYNGSGGLGVSTNNEERYFKFYPNPAKEQVTVYSTTPTAGIKLYNALGEKVYEGITNGEETKIDITGLSSGVYFAEWSTEDKVIVKKFVKE